tara:strand:- start:1343 stop:1543 length:201 start_codon:yes stop_codon:yes gene_type:complete
MEEDQKIKCSVCGNHIITYNHYDSTFFFCADCRINKYKFVGNYFRTVFEDRRKAKETLIKNGDLVL